jgi:hypothetical protein
MKAKKSMAAKTGCEYNAPGPLQFVYCYDGEVELVADVGTDIEG